MKRVALAGLDAQAPIGDLVRRIADNAPEIGPGTVAMVDSPRWPVDLDYSSQIPRQRADGARTRGVDAILRMLVAQLEANDEFRGIGRLSMFPTPSLDYFIRCLDSPACKPHLSAIGRELIGWTPRTDGMDLPAVTGGAIFTRFMLAGFAAYRAFETLGVMTFESYPDLQFRLWSHGAPPPKSRARDALVIRRRIDLRLALALGLSGVNRVATLDQADAAILALGAASARAAGMLAVIENDYEGRFALALDRAAMLALGLSAYSAA